MFIFIHSFMFVLFVYSWEQQSKRLNGLEMNRRAIRSSWLLFLDNLNWEKQIFVIDMPSLKLSDMVKHE